MMGCDFDIIHPMAKHRNHRKKRHPAFGRGSVTVVMEPEADTEKIEAEPEEAEEAAEETEASQIEQEGIYQQYTDVPATPVSEPDLQNGGQYVMPDGTQE